jgi:hypothetical protein
MTKFDEMTPQEQERLRHYAKKAQAVSLPFLLFKDGGFQLGTTDVTDSEWTALIDQSTAGWYRFNGNRVEETHTVRLLEEDEPRRPNTHTNRDLWPIGTYGNPKDPWSFGWELPLQNRETGQLAVFKASSEATRNAIGKLIEDFIATRRRPVVRLLAVETKKDGKRAPVFEVIDHDDGDGDVVDLARDDSDTAGKPRGDMDDAIPF